MKIFGGRGAILIQVLGGTALFVSAEGCSDKSGPDVESEQPSNLASIDRSAIRDILPGADIVRDLKVITTSSDRRRVEFKALGHDFALRLEYNYELFSPDLVVVRDGVEMSGREAGVVPPYRGWVEGDPKSWVRVNLRNELVEGIVFTQGDLFEVRPNAEDPHGVTMARGSIADYLDDPTGAGDAHCGVIGEAPPFTGTEKPVAPQACTWIGLHMISDYTHLAKVGGTSASAETEMNTRINEIDGIYRSDLNHGFRVEKLTTHTDLDAVRRRSRVQRARAHARKPAQRGHGLEENQRPVPRRRPGLRRARHIGRGGPRLGGRALPNRQRQQRLQLPRHGPQHDHLRCPRDGAQLRCSARRVGSGVHHGSLGQRDREDVLTGQPYVPSTLTSAA